MASRLLLRAGLALLLGWVALLLLPAGVLIAQPALPSGDGGGLSDADSSVGYIEMAIPVNLLRVRIDSAWRANRPTRAGFFYAASGPGNRGLPLRETRIDFTEAYGYLEYRLLPQLSAFVDVPLRYLNPEVNESHFGPGDLQLGFKYAAYADDQLVTTFTTRLFTPTGNVGAGLGTGHVSIQPGVLVNWRPWWGSDLLMFEGELHLWVPIGPTDSFGGEVLRYGLGVSYGPRSEDGFWVVPVAEVVGWTVLGGKEAVVFSPTDFAVQSASGDTIVNAKLGVRAGLGRSGDVYLGYGRALTGDVWYEDILRLELRWFY